MYNSSHVLIRVNIIFQSVAVWFCHKERLTDLHWDRDLTFLMHLGFIDGPFVPQNLISTQERPVPLPKIQMTSRLKNFNVLCVQGRNPVILSFSLKSPGKRIPSRFPNVAPTEKNTGSQDIFTSLLICLSLRACDKRAPSMFPNRVPMDWCTACAAVQNKQYQINLYIFMWDCGSTVVKVLYYKSEALVHNSRKIIQPTQLFSW